MSPNSKRSIWIGGGIAVAAVLAVAFFTIDYPPDGSKTAGTVAPAQRYRAEQPKAGDVKLGDQAVAQLMQTEAFDRFVKDPSTRALALDPDFRALAKYQAAGLQAVAANRQALSVAVAQAKAKAQVDGQQQAFAKASVASAKARLDTNALMQTQAQTQANVFAQFGPQADAIRQFATSPEFANIAAKNLDAAFTVATGQAAFNQLVANQAFADALAHNAQLNASLPAGTAPNAK